MPFTYKRCPRSLFLGLFAGHSLVARVRLRPPPIGSACPRPHLDLTNPFPSGLIRDLCSDRSQPTASPPPTLATPLPSHHQHPPITSPSLPLRPPDRLLSPASAHCAQSRKPIHTHLRSTSLLTVQELCSFVHPSMCTPFTRHP